MVTEKIICAGIWWDDGEPNPVHSAKTPTNTGYVTCGKGHASCFAIFRKFNLSVTGKVTQGFITTKNRFVDRKEGLDIAEKNNQITTKHPSYDELYSEDLYE